MAQSTDSKPCRFCKEPTPRLSRVCVDCQRKERKRRKRVEHLDRLGVIKGAMHYTDLNDVAARGSLSLEDWQRFNQWATSNPDDLEDVEHALASLANRLYRYSVGLDAWMRWIGRSGSCCFICDTKSHPLKLFIDHCHETGKARGLLCGQCNSGLGMLGLDGNGWRDRHRRIADYFEQATNRSRRVPVKF